MLMFSWGIALMVIGGLSFVLPLLGRQFILVSALGLAGLGSFLGGLVCFVVGLALFIIASKNQSQEQADRTAKRRSARQPTLTEPQERKSSTVNLSNSNAVATKSTGSHRGFCFANEKAVTPLAYGFHAVKLAVDGSAKAIKTIIGTSETKIQQEISANHGPAQLHLLALNVAVFYVCADKLCSSNRDVLSEVAAGISTGFVAIFGDDSSTSKEPGLPQFLYELFQEHAPLLAKELNEFNDDNPFDMGATANLAAKYIGKQCGVDELLSKNQAAKMHIEIIASSIGIKLLINLLGGKHISYTN